VGAHTREPDSTSPGSLRCQASLFWAVWWDHGRMVDDHPTCGHLTPKWPLEGHFVVGGSGLYAHRDCLGREFTSRTANYDLTIGLPQLDTGAGARSILLPPMWAYGPPSDSERLYEGNQITWGVAPSPPGVKVYPESARDVALVYRCRFFTTLTALDDAEFSTAADDFLSELGDW
jgi:hypothetical protein